MDTLHAVFRKLEHLGDRFAQRIDALAVRPNREGIVLVQSDRARRTDGTVHLIRTTIIGLDGFGDAGGGRMVIGIDEAVVGQTCEVVEQF